MTAYKKVLGRFTELSDGRQLKIWGYEGESTFHASLVTERAKLEMDTVEFTILESLRSATDKIMRSYTLWPSDRKDVTRLVRGAMLSCVMVDKDSN